MVPLPHFIDLLRYLSEMPESRAKMPKPNKKRNRLQFATPDRDPEIQPKLEWTPDHHHGEDQKLASIQLPSSAVHLALSPDEKFTAVVVGENKQSELQIYCIKDSQLVETVQLWSGHVFGLSFAPSLPYHGGYMVAVSKTCEGAMLCYLDHRGRLPENVSPAVDRDALCERLGHDIISILADYHYTQETNETGEFPEGITDTLRKAFDQGQKEHKMPYPLDGDRVVFSTDGTFLITAVMYDPISTSKGAPLGYGISIWWVAISPDSRFIAFGESDTSVQIWNLETGRFNDPPSLRGTLIRHGVFSPDSAYIALVNRPGDSNASVHIHNLTGGKRVSSLWDVASCSEPTSWNHDGTLLAVLRAQKEISLWNPSADQRPTKMEWSLPSHTPAYPKPIQFIDRGRKLMFTSASGTIDVYDMLSLTLRRFPGEKGTIRNALCARDGSFLAVMEGRVLTFWKLK